MVIDRPNQVWATDLTYIPMRRGFVYLVAIVDWATRKVLAHRVYLRLKDAMVFYRSRFAHFRGTA